MKPPGRYSLTVAITLALILKVAILYGLWKAFFSEPQTKKMRLPTGQVEKHLLPPAAPVQAIRPKGE